MGRLLGGVVLGLLIPGTAWAVCGDSTVDSAEQCDDGNRIGGDGCSALCFTEAGRTDVTEQSGFWMWAPPYDYSFFNMVDDDPTTTWSQPTNQPLWINMDVAAGTPSTIDEYTITNGANGAGNDPVGWFFTASPDGIQWDTLDIQTGVTFAYANQSLTFPVPANGVQYMYFTIGFDGVHGPNIEIAEIELVQYTGPQCGNGAVETGETCDDGNTVTETCTYGQTSCTVCDATCQSVPGAATFCGDNTVNGSEVCDDGNTVTEACPYGQTSCTVCDATCNNVAGATAYCGDGTTNGPEVCDDGAANGGFGACNSTCDGTVSLCGNGIHDPGEECDIGSFPPTCLYGSNYCFACDATCTVVVQPASYCGDGVINGPEVCDDGPANGSYGRCNATCDAITPFCGDGILHSNEQCDDGNNVTESCAYGQTSCTVCDATCQLAAGSTAWCGDGVTQTAQGGIEYCDDGPNNGLPNHCDQNCSWITPPVCGNGVVEGAEECDDGNTILEACPPNQGCQVCSPACDLANGLPAYCGDGNVDPGEVCDDGLLNGQPYHCAPDCASIPTPQLCGNGRIDVNEYCDDGNTIRDACPYGSLCFVCDSQCAETRGVQLYCGDGRVDGPETCDDGPLNGSAGACPANCGAAGPVCGNGIVEAGESCDDGNIAIEYCPPGGGPCTVCLPSCQSTVMAPGYCGDGILNGPELCDLGPLNGQPALSGCSTNCEWAVPLCGDGIIQNVEVCDDGNTIIEDCPYSQSCLVCGPACTMVPGRETHCGDGVVTGPEVCDQHSTYNGQPNQCNATCDGITPSVCGNSIVEPGENCDWGSSNSTSCAPGETSCQRCDPTTCQLSFYQMCGNGVIDPGEVCDDGPFSYHCAYGLSSCSICESDCQRTRPGLVHYCGDTFVEGPEECDDGNNVTETCPWGSSECLVCDANCNSVPGTTAYCGDGVVNGPEACDDGWALNGVPGNCDYTCRRHCGNGVVEGIENCDDGNYVTEVCPYGQTSCTVCASYCILLPGATSYCGDGSVDATNGEQCDDGNAVTETCPYDAPSCTVCNATCATGPGITTFCGDGVVNGPEVCDDGASNGSPGSCNAACSGTVPLCGNGTVEVGETCDDGNTVTETCAYGQTSCTVCDATCQSVPGATSVCGDSVVDTTAGESCDDGDTIMAQCPYGSASCSVCDAACNFVPGTPRVCGDGIQQAEEQCDVGTTVVGTCAPGETFCTVCGPNCWQVTIDLNLCGNGTLDAISGEECDDGNAVTDLCPPGTQCTVCDSTCRLAPGGQSTCGNGVVDAAQWEVCDDGTNNGTGPGFCNDGCSAIASYCGDGVVHGAEQCDDGNAVTELCPLGQASCTVCDATCQLVAGQASGCGDGVVDPHTEDCDDGNRVRESCAYGQSCTVCHATCYFGPGIGTNCGDGIVNGPEVCDDGTNNGTPGLCNVTCDGQVPICGNGVIEAPGENCDDGNTTTEVCAYGQMSCTVCDSTCTLTSGATSFCGDGSLDLPNGEQCDDGNTIVDDCPYNAPSCTVCGSSCTNVAGILTNCGDGIVNGPEICDDGALNGTPGACNGTCDGGVPVCGDGIVEALEPCDDGNTITETCAYGQTSCFVCDATCNFVSGVTAYCSDGTINGPETCDDGNVVTEACAYGQTSCTVCDASCQDAMGATSYCGDGTTNGPEACDDGNTTTETCAYGQPSCTVCDASCQNTAGTITSCGDGTINGPETCDDGASNGTPGLCNTTCDGATPLCGNGVLEVGEQCDDGNVIDGDGCSSVCQSEAPAFVDRTVEPGFWMWAPPYDYTFFNMVDDDVASIWSNPVSNGTWLNMDFAGATPSAYVISRYTITNGPNGAANDPVGWDISASADGVNYTIIDSQAGVTFGGPNQTLTFVIAAPAAYTYFTVGFANTTGTIQIAEIELLERTTITCGDGIVGGTEQCDDGNTVTETCAYGQTSCTVCDATCQSVAGATSLCGDGVTDTANGEVCDDGGNNGTLGFCNIACSGPTPVCGDGVVGPGEQCDDGNTISGDGCSATCTLEGPPTIDRTTETGFWMWAPPYDYTFFDTVDDDVTSYWSTTVSAGTWMNMDFVGATPNAYVIREYTLTSGPNARANDPAGWTLWASPDNVNWVLLDSQSGVVFPGPNTTLSFPIVNVTAHTYFSFGFTTNGGSNLQIAELELLEYVGP